MKREHTVRIKRVYEPPDVADGRRVLVDRLWPRGLAREAARIDVWMKEIAPSHELRRWFDHDPDRWQEFRSRYAAELDANASSVQELLDMLRTGTVTILYGTREDKLNNAVALRDYLDAAARVSPATRR